MKSRDFILMRHETEQSVDQPLQLERVDDHLPVDFDAPRIEARAKGFRQMERLATDREACRHASTVKARRCWPRV
jgi:hypothetical protein